MDGQYKSKEASAEIFVDTYPKRCASEEKYGFGMLRAVSGSGMPIPSASCDKTIGPGKKRSGKYFFHELRQGRQQLDTSHLTIISEY